MILAVLKFNSLDIAAGYDVFDFDQDGRISFRDIRKKCQELSLEVSAEEMRELFQALAGPHKSSISREAWARCLAIGDADIVFSSMGLAPDDILVAQTVQDVIDDIIDTLVRQGKPPKDPEWARNVSFAQDCDCDISCPLMVKMLSAEATVDLTREIAMNSKVNIPTLGASVSSFAANTSQPATSPSPIRSIRTPQGVLIVEPAQEITKTPFKQPDNVHPQIVTEENLPRDFGIDLKRIPETSAQTVRSEIWLCHESCVPFLKFVHTSCSEKRTTCRLIKNTFQ